MRVNFDLNARSFCHKLSVLKSDTAMDDGRKNLVLPNGGPAVENGGDEEVNSGRDVSSSASDRSSLSPGVDSPDGLNSPDDYCKQVRVACRVYDKAP